VYNISCKTGIYFKTRTIQTEGAILVASGSEVIGNVSCAFVYFPHFCTKSSTLKIRGRVMVCSSVVEHMLSMCEALGLTHSK
jgi:hypothetical protein